MKTNSIVPCYYESTSLDDAQMPGRNARRKKVLVEKSGVSYSKPTLRTTQTFFCFNDYMNLRSLL